MMASHTKETDMRKFLIEGANDGGLFAETVEAETHGEAEALAVERLCEAWGHTHTDDTTLDDLGDSAMVTEYSADDYARDAAADMLAFVDQIARFQTNEEADGVDLGNDEAMQGLIRRARALAATARGEAGTPSPEQPVAAPPVPAEWQYSKWRHGGWYVDNVRYPGGACGCVSRNYEDGKWRIVCDPRPFEERPTFKSRDEAALAEFHLAAAEAAQKVAAA